MGGGGEKEKKSNSSLGKICLPQSQVCIPEFSQQSTKDIQNVLRVWPADGALCNRASALYHTFSGGVPVCLSFLQSLVAPVTSIPEAEHSETTMCQYH